MPRASDFETILVIGAGPIMIGQACEFDYSGVQALKSLKEEGYRVILVNSNPATIMTDGEFADVTYIEPLTLSFLEKIISREKPCALLPTMGGQTALNLAVALDDAGVLTKHGVRLIGASRRAIELAESRELFRNKMKEIGLECVAGEEVHDFASAQKIAHNIGYPVILRPSFTLGGAGGGIAHDEKELEQKIREALHISPVGGVIVEESIVGWKEYEMEVVRDKRDNCIIVCSIENIDPMGIHTGDSITVAPALTLTDKEYQIMRDASCNVLRAIGVETGGSNVQFAVNPENGKMVVIEANPRVSRSSALASKATGFPIAKVAAKLSVGYLLDEIQNDITECTPASFEPTLDYIVTKIPRFSFEKFPDSEAKLGTSMKSVGEVMALGRNFAESLQKALRTLNSKITGLSCPDFAHNMSDKELFASLSEPYPERILLIAESLRRGMDIKKVQKQCRYDAWFLNEIQKIIAMEETLKKSSLPQTREKFAHLKAMGFGDKRIAELTGEHVQKVFDTRAQLGLKNPIYKRIDSCSSEFPASTAYMYGTWDYGASFGGAHHCEAHPPDEKKVLIIGSGPNRIGQGIEFDYCCVHASFALKKRAICSVMVNCNPETVSTDYDTSDRLYFEPLTAEDITAIARKEQEQGELLGAIVQFGGQTPLRLSRDLEQAGIPILGTSLASIDACEERKQFGRIVQKLNLKQPRQEAAHSFDEAVTLSETIGYPLILRPSYVLGGRAMEIIYNRAMLETYLHEAMRVTGEDSLLIDSYLHDAIEVDVDAICDGGDVYVAGIMEHIEQAGVHSGDSACSLPPRSLSDDIIAELEKQTKELAIALSVRGLMNVQFAICGKDIFVLEVNPRASRTIPFIAKATGIPLVQIATDVMLGEHLKNYKLKSWRSISHVAVKEAVMPFHRFPGSDCLLGPEMKSTGEVMGIDRNFNHAFAKAQLAAGTYLPHQGTAFLSVCDHDKNDISLSIARHLLKAGLELKATKGTQEWLNSHDVKASPINKLSEGGQHIVQELKEDKIQLVINTTASAGSAMDGLAIRHHAILYGIPYYTTLAGAYAASLAIKDLKNHSLSVKPLQNHYREAIVSDE